MTCIDDNMASSDEVKRIPNAIRADEGLREQAEVGGLEAELDLLGSSVLMLRLRDHHDDYLYQHIDGGTVLRRSEMLGLSRRAGHGLSLLSTEEAKSLQRADLVVIDGRDPETGQRLSAVVEASNRVGRRDIERARGGADILVRHGQSCVALVVTNYAPSEEWARLAEEAGVAIVVIGANADDDAA
jgi:hypothetical protein